MSDIPCDILHEIFSFLPAKALFRFRTVCKAWCRIIDNRLSYSALLIRDSKGRRLFSLSLDSLNYTDDSQTIDVTPVEQLIGDGVPRISCNGLILISYSGINKNSCVIWNPIIQEFHKLPQPKTGLLRGYDYKYDWLRSNGICYDYASYDYEVVRIDKLYNRETIVFRALLYSLKSRSWRRIKDCPYDILLFDSVSTNGALHWRSRDKDGGIIALDLETEDYNQLPWPPIPTKPHGFDEHLDALDRCLVLSCYHDKMKSFEGWIMKEYGVEKSWMKLFPIEYVRGVRPVAYLKSRKHVLLKSLRQVLRQCDECLYLINLENNSLKKVIIDAASHISSFQFFPGSFSVGAKRTAGVKRKKKTAERLKFCVKLTNSNEK